MSSTAAISLCPIKNNFNESRHFPSNGFRAVQRLGTVDKKVFERLRRLITETAKAPFAGIGKPEPLKGNLKGYWSRRITDEHRLVYRATDDQLIVIACKYHYE